MPLSFPIKLRLRAITSAVSLGALTVGFLGGGVRGATAETDSTAAAQTDKRTPPVAIRTVNPKHPAELLKKLVNGDAEIDCLVTAEGRVADARVLTASHPQFGEAAVEAVREWEFRPAERNGTPIAMRVRIPISYQLSGEQLLEGLAGHPVQEEITDSIIPAEQLPAWPYPKKILMPRYPEILRGSGKYGKAVVAIVINREGKVINPKVVKYTYPEFIWPALVTAVSLQFEPVRVGKSPIYVSMELQYDFKAEEGKPKGTTPETKAKTPVPKKR